ncbi:Wadjet anti-phage system protein JetD domain-containing protein [Trichloromonas sp.]|uniref:Wadjet anti-phage system protein JetD domain-containing protein n=1 Tax=Trichloromonas sp. TaxID=3069249 RepID=UPI002A38C3CE|nr:DUF2220 family protein [Trichloromonas sp.]
MTSSAKNNVHVLLTRLLDFWQKQPDRKIRIKISKIRAPEYFVEDAEVREEIHAILTNAEAAGAICLEWGKGYDRHLLTRIELVSPKKLAAFLGMPLAVDVVSSCRGTLEEAIASTLPWIESWAIELMSSWGKNRRYNGLPPGDIENALNLVRMFDLVESGAHGNLDLRTFSVRCFGNSKTVEGLLSQFATGWRRFHPTELSGDELFDSLGLTKFPHPVLLKGPVTLDIGEVPVDCRNLQPYVGFPPQAIRNVTGIPEYILTIENLASFNRYAGEIRDGGMVLYSGGFPSPNFCRLYQLLDTRMPKVTPFYHWGDMDEGGVKIFAFLEKQLHRPLRPHLMTRELLAERGTSSPQVRKRGLLSAGNGSTTASGLAGMILETDPPNTLEQELVDPVSPG